MRLITLIPFEIFCQYLAFIYQVKMVCHMLEWLPPLAVLLSYLPSTNLTGERLRAQCIKTCLRYINGNW